jgi:uncharacterized protein YaiL (DUF2058 family)
MPPCVGQPRNRFMTNSMKDLLMGLGFKSVAPQKEAQAPRAKETSERPRTGQPERKNSTHLPPPRRDAHARKPDPRFPPTQRVAHPQRVRPAADAGRTHRDLPRTREEIDLAKAYAIRAQKEKDERIEAERLKQEAARIKREAKAKVAELLKDKALNDASAELTRHFDYNGKIRRVHVTDVQLKSLNAGELGVVQLDGRYHLVEAALACEVQALLPSLLALLVDPNAPVADDPYADPRYKIPDDLVW